MKHFQVLSEERPAFFTLTTRMQQAIIARLGWRSLRPVQEASIAPLLSGDDVLILAPTAGGKTEAAMLPLLDRLQQNGWSGQPAICYLCPLKALINNLLPRLQDLAQLAGREAFAWHGETSASQRKAFLEEPQSVLLITPESLQIILASSRIDSVTLFAGLQAIVIDEVHAFAGSERGDQLITLLHQLDRVTGSKLQRVGLSATIGNPEELLSWLGGGRGRRETLIDPSKIKGQQAKKLIEVHAVGDDPEKCAAMVAKLAEASPKSLLFVNSRRQAEEMNRLLQGYKTVTAIAHHSSLSQQTREKSEAAFKLQASSRKLAQLIVCTSTLELGLDVGDIDRVFQLGAPSSVSSFLQRFGRAGRRLGQVSHMVFITDQEQTFLKAIALISLAIAKKVEPLELEKRSFAVLGQQILLCILKQGVIGIQKLWEAIGSPPCFSGISDKEKNLVLNFMLQNNWLYLSEGRLILGERSEKEFGRSHFLELFSVFSSSTTVRVKNKEGISIGTIDQALAARLFSNRQSFVLGGRSWLPLYWDKNTAVLTVTSSLAGEVVQWSGERNEVSFAIARQIRFILTDSAPVAFLGPKAQQNLDKLRSKMKYLDAEQPLVKQTGKAHSYRTNIELWAGERVQRTLGQAFAGWLNCEASYDEKSLSLDCKLETWHALMTSAILTDPQEFLESGIAAYQQKHDLATAESKFAQLLPLEFRRELEWKKAYDLKKAAEVLKELVYFKAIA